jgi:hypothetical protein
MGGYRVISLARLSLDDVMRPNTITKDIGFFGTGFLNNSLNFCNHITQGVDATGGTVNLEISALLALLKMMVVPGGQAASP